MRTEYVSGTAAGSDEMPLALADAQKILALAHAANGSPKEWAALLVAIPEASCRILRIVNAAYGGLHWHIASVGQAMAYLGFNTVKSLACTLAGSPDLAPRRGARRKS